MPKRFAMAANTATVIRLWLTVAVLKCFQQDVLVSSLICAFRVSFLNLYRAASLQVDNNKLKEAML